jgi:HAD superfamily hydrolase (TIGR01549 family)
VPALRAVLFDWGDTLFHFAYDDGLLEAGWQAGLDAIGRDGLPAHDEAAAHFRDAYLPLLVGTETIEEVEYPGVIREVLAGFGAEATEEEIGRFLVAEHAAWAPARQLGAHTHSLLDLLRERGLRLGLVSNAFDPGWLLRQDLEAMGLASRLDTAVFSSEVGLRKPHAAPFERALSELAVEPDHALFVGDSRRADVGGAAALGLTTVQAYWFRADPDERGPEPDFEAFTPMDVLNVVRRLTDER